MGRARRAAPIDFGRRAVDCDRWRRPGASFIGIVLGLGRLYENHEMAAMAACGVGGWRMSWPVVLIVLVIATVLAWLVLVYNPRAAAEQDALKVRALQIGSYSDLRAGEFRSFDSGSLVLYAGQVSESGELPSIFAQRLADKEDVVIVARRGRRAKCRALASGPRAQ